MGLKLILIAGNEAGLSEGKRKEKWHNNVNKNKNLANKMIEVMLRKNPAQLQSISRCLQIIS